MEKKSAKGVARKKGKKNRKIGRNANRCKRYRSEIGMPHGPGRPGAKSGKNWIRHTVDNCMTCARVA